MHHSEFGQDKWLDEVVFKGKRNGVFFECGALDGVLDSNSLFFEQERGWTGLCVEANPDVIETLRKNRACIVEHCALMSVDDYAVSYIKIKGGLFGWGGIRRHIEPQHMARILEHTKETDRETVLVRGICLDTLLTTHGLKKIDYLTLDIEGAEYSVIEVFPFHKYDIDVFEIENNFDNYPIEEIMNKNGFKKINRMGVSDIYRKAGRE
jgi:FkbM family methyltransferase